MRHKRSGGITIAQKLETAAQPDMPESAIETGVLILFFPLRILLKRLYELRTRSKDVSEKKEIDCAESA